MTTTAPDPLLQAARIILRTARDDMRAAIEGLPPDAVNWAPAGEDTNSIAVLVHHSWHSTRQWLAVTVEATLPERERSAEFTVSYEDAPALIAALEELSDQCLALISKDKHVDPGAIRPHWDPGSDLRFTVSWTLIHALEHLREHVGHVGLTRQLWDAAVTPAQHQ
jgi:hypothetical protein